MMPKTYVLDTNVLLHNPESLFAFEENDVVIPFAVIEEIDSQKKRQDEVGRNARVVAQKLDAFRQAGRLSDGIRLPQGGEIRIELNHQEFTPMPPGWDPLKGDNRLIGLAGHLKRTKEGPVVLVTKDLNLRIKADLLGISAEDFTNDKVDYERLYTGVHELRVSPETLNHFYRDGKVRLEETNGLFPHQFVVLRNCSQASGSALTRYDQNMLWPLVHGDSVSWGIKALNKEQKFALEVLMNDQVKVVTLVGRAGTGKTLLALSAGLEKVLEERGYARLLVTRPVVPMGNDLGYLPGTMEEKLRPWMQPIYDNLEFLFSNQQDPMETVSDLMHRGVLIMEALTYMRGRSIPKQFIICDEAQNLSPHMIKTLITRIGEGSKIVFTGDPEQIDHPYLDASSNGLTYLIERLKNEEIAGHVTLTKGERSKVAELGARLL
jgi:PhoH-like ATPase